MASIDDKSTTIAEEDLLLCAKYKEIAKKSVLLANGWPASQSFCNLLDKNPGNSHYTVPSFPENGPVVLLAFINQQQNPTALPWMQECLQLFDDFCAKELNLTADEGKCGVWTIPARVPHVVVTVFQEHPSLLADEEQRKLFRPIDTPAMNNLINALDNNGLLCFPKLSLRLAALLFTPDGALIAGCVPADAASSVDFHRLREHCAQAAAETIGGTTSRPKSLIHVTLGRVLRVDVDSNNSKTSLVERYNRTILPDLLRSIQDKKMDVWTMEHLTLLRNTRWLCEENEIYHSWTLLDGDAGDER